MRLAVKEGPISYVDQHSSGANFLALRELFSRLPTDRVINVLDLGPAWNTNIQFFSQFRTKLYVDDVFRWKQRSPSGTKAVDVLQQYPQGTQFDVILVWDLFDYLDKPEMAQLISHLETYCKAGTLIFMVTSTLDKVPKEPAIFKILDAERLLYKTTTEETFDGRKLRQADLLKLLPGCSLVRAFRMSTGVEENLFIYK